MQCTAIVQSDANFLQEQNEMCSRFFLFARFDESETKTTQFFVEEIVLDWKRSKRMDVLDRLEKRCNSD